MKTREITTTDLSDFSSDERYDLVQLLNAWRYQGLPSDFYQDEVVPMMNKNSGNVFLTNSEYQVAMMNGNKLEIFHSCSNCGHEGFSDECQLNSDGCNECKSEQYAKGWQEVETSVGE